MATEPNERVLVEVHVRKLCEARALKAFLNAANLLGLALGRVIAEYRAKDEPLLVAAATIAELRVQLAAADRKIAILHERLARVPARQRPHYTPGRRFDLEVKAVLRETAAVTAEWAKVSFNTILRWEAEAASHPERRSIGSLLKALPPIQRYADAERRLVQWMHRMGFPGSGSICRALLREGRRISARTIRRIQREQPLPIAPASSHRLAGHHPNHVWIADITEIPALFRIFSFKLLVILDAFSRFPVAARVSLTRPTADQLADLFRRAVERHGRPMHFVSDKGTPFRTKRFARELRRLHVQQRFGALGQHGSIALIERLFKTLKYDFSLRHAFTLSLDVVERRLNLALIYYTYLRPHRSLGAATPAERYFGLRPTIHAVSPPRGRPGDVTEPPPYEVLHLDPDHRSLPILFRIAA
jgi:transposase InsO family protein